MDSVELDPESVVDVDVVIVEMAAVCMVVLEIDVVVVVKDGAVVNTAVVWGNVTEVTVDISVVGADVDVVVILCGVVVSSVTSSFIH